MNAEPGTQSLRPGESWRALIVALAVSAGYVGVAAARGALGASRNDDWVYLRAVYAFADTGHIVLDSWTQAMLIGLVIMASPVVAVFGHAIAPLHVMVAGLGAVGLWAAYCVVRGMLSRGWAALAVGLLAFGPIFGNVATTFMTDVPAYCFQMLALLAAYLAIRGDKFVVRWFAASLALGLVAFSIRELAIPAIVAASIVAFAKARAQSPRLGWWVAGMAASWLAVAAALYLWRAGLVSSPAHMPLTGKPGIVKTGRAVLMLALMLAPVAFLISLSRIAKKGWADRRVSIAVAAIGLPMIILFIRIRGYDRQIGQYLSPTGSYGASVVGQPPTALPPAVWTALCLLALVSLLVIVAALSIPVSARIRTWAVTRRITVPRDWGLTLVATYCLAAGALDLAIALLTSQPLFDRYLIPLVPFMAALVLRVAVDENLLVRRTRPAALASLFVFGLFGLGIVDNAATLDGARWRLAEAVRDQGYSADSINAGYEWYGLHQPGPIVGDTGGGENFWIYLFKERPICATVRFVPPGAPLDNQGVLAESSGRTLIGAPYRLVAVAGPSNCSPGDGRHP